VLCVLTAIEVGFYYLEGDIPTALLVGCLLALALVKFIMVASLYMHLSSDKPIFKRFFITGAVGAMILYTIVLTPPHLGLSGIDRDSAPAWQPHPDVLLLVGLLVADTRSR